MKTPPTWEEEFDAEYGHLPLEQWCVGLVSSALVKGRERNFSDASYITRKLVEKFTSREATLRQEIGERVDAMEGFHISKRKVLAIINPTP